MQVELSIIIRRSIGEVFAYVNDLRNLVEWMGMVTAVKCTSTASPEPGWQFRCAFRFLGQRVEQTFEVIEWQTNGHITLKSTSGNIPCVFSYRFDAIAEGTLVCLEVVLRPVPTGEKEGLPEALVARMMHRQVASDALTLKELLEGQPCHQEQNRSSGSVTAHRQHE